MVWVRGCVGLMGWDGMNKQRVFTVCNIWSVWRDAGTRAGYSRPPQCWRGTTMSSRRRKEMVKHTAPHSTSVSSHIQPCHRPEWEREREMFPLFAWVRVSPQSGGYSLAQPYSKHWALHPNCQTQGHHLTISEGHWGIPTPVFTLPLYRTVVNSVQSPFCWVLSK